MNTISMQHRPAHLPQVNMPYSIVVDKLNNENIGNKFISVNPNLLKPLQGITFSHEVDGIDSSDDRPIWIDKDLNVLDGHHRLVKSLYGEEGLINAIMIDLDTKNACRILNKIQDIYDYELQNGAENDKHKSFLDYVENGDTNVDEENSNEQKNVQKFIGYRKDKINNNSVIGNFFTLEPDEKSNKYEIEFDNILDTNDMGIAYKNSQNPIDILAKAWFPHVNFMALSKEHGVSDFNLKCKAIAEKARKHGYDGIKYGDLIIQGLN